MVARRSERESIVARRSEIPAFEQLSGLFERAGSSALELSGPDGTTVEIPTPAVRALRIVVDALAHGRRLELSTSAELVEIAEAADIVGLPEHVFRSMLALKGIPVIVVEGRDYLGAADCEELRRVESSLRFLTQQGDELAKLLDVDE